MFIVAAMRTVYSTMFTTAPPPPNLPSVEPDESSPFSLLFLFSINLAFEKMNIRSVSHHLSEVMLSKLSKNRNK
jgi:hypothetical protein